MNDRDFEELLTELLAWDLSTGTEEFRETLLARCLSILNDDAYLDDSRLNLVAAAGDACAPERTTPTPGTTSTPGGDTPLGTWLSGKDGAAR